MNFVYILAWMFVNRLLTYIGHLREANMYTSAESSSEVAGAGQDVSKMVIPHVFPTIFLNVLLHLF